jgi:hypothetical protein
MQAAPATSISMGMNTSYTIEPDGGGGFQVRETLTKGDNGHVVTGFPTWGKAQDWINDRLKATSGTVSPLGWT